MTESNPYLLALTALIGLCIGSFINVVISRLPRQLEQKWQNESRELLGLEHTANEQKLSVVFPPSHCPDCHEPIRPWHNIPVISYIFLKGKCNHCSVPISIQYPLVELSGGLIFIVVFLHFGLDVKAFLALIFCLTLLILTGIDFKTQLLPDNLTLPLLWLGLIANSMNLFTSLENAVFGAIFGYLSLWLVFWCFKLLTGKEGMGYGDFKLLAALGAWLGWQQLPLIILISSIIGTIVALTLILFVNKDRRVPIAFGPYLASAGLVSMFSGEYLMNSYFNLLF